MTRKIIATARSLQLVFKNPNYIALASILAIVITLIIFLISVLILHYGLLVYVFTSGIFGLEAKMQIFWDLLTAIRLNFSFSSIVIMVSLSALLAIDIAIFTFYFKKQMAVRAEAGVGVFGLLIGLLGIGCSACGSIILSSILGFTTATALIGFLPFAGLEFGIIGIFLLLLSIYLIALKIQASDNCTIP